MSSKAKKPWPLQKRKMNNLRDYIKESASRKPEHYFIAGNTTVFVKDPLPDNVDISKLLSAVEAKIPNYFLENIDVIYVGQFEILNNREVNALYSDGAVYVTNAQDDVEDMLDDIVHEVAHSLEEVYSAEIYADQDVESEFLGKRIRLQAILKSHDYNIEDYDFKQSDYSTELDDFFYKEVGYPTMTSLTSGLFYSPYAATSLREYFANGFENFYLADRNYLKQISPKLFEKIYLIHQLGDTQI